MSDADNPMALGPEAESVKAFFDELRALRHVIDQAEMARVRRLEIWLELRDIRAGNPQLMRALGATQEAIAEASGITPTTLSQTYKRQDEEADKK